MEKSNNSSSSMNILGLLGVAFVTLKLCKVINWSWWCITVPFWGGAAIMLLFLIIYISLKYIFK